MSGHEDADESRRRYQAPYSRRHQIPTIAKYKEEKEARIANAGRDDADEADGADLGPSRTDRAKEGLRSYWYGDKEQDPKGSGQQKNDAQQQQQPQQQQQQQQQRNGAQTVDVDGDGDADEDDEQQANAVMDTSEATPAPNPASRKKRGGKKEERAEREVTDPVTHLPVRIYDFTDESLKKVDENPPAYGSTKKTATGLSNQDKSGDEVHQETEETQQGTDNMRSLFPPPDYDEIRKDLTDINKQGMTVGLAGTASIILLTFAAERVLRPQLGRLLGSEDHRSWLPGIGIWPLLLLVCAGCIWYLIQGIREWMANRINDTWESQIWEANLQSRQQAAKAYETESVQWLNSVLGSVWPLINPDLFTSLADTLEDVMQASIPKLVQMVAVEDVGQGTENLRILGVRWLPTGAAARSVGSDGNLQSGESGKPSNDRSVPGQGEVDDSAESKDDKDDDQQGSGEENKREDGSEGTQVAEGMEAEEGNFINLEVAFAYRARASQSFKDRTKDMHLYLAFYLPGNLKIPVWVDMKGLVGSCRLRLQLTPDPPFFALCTLTFLGQPKVDISCVPLIKHGLNLMDLPLISNFVQSSVDAAMAEYVAPKSLTLDLKDMLAGDDFKKDTAARGVLVVDIKRGYDFKEGDASIPMISDGSSDPYVSVGWAKFGKPLFSTRVLISEMEPYWHERAVLLVTPEELNVAERLRLQLWDSDRFTADDDLGRIEVDLKHIMRADESNGKMCDRTDGFRALKAGEDMPGKLDWSVGYFSKTRLQACQFENQTYDKEIRSMDQLKQKVDETCQRKLREASIKGGRHSRNADELEQQKQQEMKAKEDAIIISAPPPDNYPSGVFSIQIHQITNLELEKLSKSDVEKNAHADDDTEQGEGLPSAYCNIIINHKKVFTTRTKPKNAKPFYNAGTERFIPDWRNCEVYVSVRDARVDEEDPLLGIVHLPLADVFAERAQVNGYYPLMGGVGFGRMRISMVWRSVQLQAPPECLGWHYGTVEVKPTISSSDIPQDLQGLKMKLHTNIGSGKMYPHEAEHTWQTRRGRSIYLPTDRRYASCLAIRFKRNGMFKDKTSAFSILWLKDIPDEEERDLTLPVCTGNFERAQANCLDEPGEKVGTINLKVKFWAGLGAAHQKWASKDPNLRNVMEVLDVARDNYESKKSEQAAGIVEGDDDDDASSSSDGETADSSADETFEVDSHGEEKSTKAKSNGNGAGNDEEKPDGHQNIIDRVKDYKQHSKQEHRRNRGVMQYKLPRTAQWASNKAESVERKVSGIFKRHTREPGIETEV